MVFAVYGYADKACTDLSATLPKTAGAFVIVRALQEEAGD